MAVKKKKKMFQTVNYLAAKSGGSVPTMSLLKLVWLSDRLHMRKYGRTVTGDGYYAMKFGPVATKIYSGLQDGTFLSSEERAYAGLCFKKVGQYEIASASKPDLDFFSDSDVDVLDLVYNTFGVKDRFELSEFSHNFPEWSKFERLLKLGTNKRYEMDLLDFFTDALIDSDFFDQPKETIEFSKKLFQAELVIDRMYSE